jgi:hypothetical protein
VALGFRGDRAARSPQELLAAHPEVVRVLSSLEVVRPKRTRRTFRKVAFKGLELVSLELGALHALLGSGAPDGRAAEKRHGLRSTIACARRTIGALVEQDKAGARDAELELALWLRQMPALASSDPLAVRVALRLGLLADQLAPVTRTLSESTSDATRLTVSTK